MDPQLIGRAYSIWPHCVPYRFGKVDKGGLTGDGSSGSTDPAGTPCVSTPVLRTVQKHVNRW